MLNYRLPVADVGHKTFSPALGRSGDDMVAANAKSPGLYHQLELMMLPALGNAARKFSDAQAAVDLARITAWPRVNSPHRRTRSPPALLTRCPMM